MQHEPFGKILGETRDKLGLSIEQATAATRVRRKFLKAFEEGDFLNMPPKGYAQNMIGSYARFLDINPTPIIEAYLRDLARFELSEGSHDVLSTHSAISMPDDSNSSRQTSSFSRETSSSGRDSAAKRTAKRYPREKSSQRFARHSGAHGRVEQHSFVDRPIQNEPFDYPDRARLTHDVYEGVDDNTYEEIEYGRPVRPASKEASNNPFLRSAYNEAKNDPYSRIGNDETGHNPYSRFARNETEYNRYSRSNYEDFHRQNDSRDSYDLYDEREYAYDNEGIEQGRGSYNVYREKPQNRKPLLIILAIVILAFAALLVWLIVSGEKPGSSVTVAPVTNSNTTQNSNVSNTSGALDNTVSQTGATDITTGAEEPFEFSFKLAENKTSTIELSINGMSSYSATAIGPFVETYTVSESVHMVIGTPENVTVLINGTVVQPTIANDGTGKVDITVGTTVK